MFADIPQLSYIKSLVSISMTFQINSEKQKQTNPQEKPYLQKKETNQKHEYNQVLEHLKSHLFKKVNEKKNTLHLRFHQMQTDCAYLNCIYVCL